MNATNRLEVEFPAKSENEALARAVVSAFAVQLDPNLDELSDLKTAVSEAVTNAIIHGYRESASSSSIEDQPVESYGTIKMECLLYQDGIEISITDYGCGISDIEQAKQPMYTSAPELERSGMGFTIMESFMDKLEVHSEVGLGTTVKLFKTFGSLSQR